MNISIQQHWQHIIMLWNSWLSVTDSTPNPCFTPVERKWYSGLKENGPSIKNVLQVKSLSVQTIDVKNYSSHKRLSILWLMSLWSKCAFQQKHVKRWLLLSPVLCWSIHRHLTLNPYDPKNRRKHFTQPPHEIAAMRRKINKYVQG